MWCHRKHLQINHLTLVDNSSMWYFFKHLYSYYHVWVQYDKLLFCKSTISNIVPFDALEHFSLGKSLWCGWTTVPILHSFCLLSESQKPNKEICHPSCVSFECIFCNKLLHFLIHKFMTLVIVVLISNALLIWKILPLSILSFNLLIYINLACLGMSTVWGAAATMGGSNAASGKSNCHNGKCHCSYSWRETAPLGCAIADTPWRELLQWEISMLQVGEATVIMGSAIASTVAGETSPLGCAIADMSWKVDAAENRAEKMCQ